MPKRKGPKGGRHHIKCDAAGVPKKVCRRKSESPGVGAHPTCQRLSAAGLSLCEEKAVGRESVGKTLECPQVPLSSLAQSPPPPLLPEEVYAGSTQQPLPSPNVLPGSWSFM